MALLLASVSCFLFPSVFRSQAEATLGTLVHFRYSSHLLLVAFQIGKGFVDFPQIGLLALAGEVQKESVLQIRAVET